MSHRDLSRIPLRTHLRIVGAPDLPRRVLDAAAREMPPPELTRRMEQALGISAAASTAAAAKAAAAKAAAVTGEGAGAVVAAATGKSAGAGVTWAVLWSSLAIGVVLAVLGAIVGVRLSRHDEATSAPAASAAPAPAVTTPAVASPPTAPDPPSPPARPVVAEAPPAPIAPSAAPVVIDAPAHHGAMAAAPSDLRAEIALIDAARSAVVTNANDRALALLRVYETTYPSGTFGPEATALRIEALEHLGHSAQARALAQKFIAAHPDSPLTKRVAHETGLESR